MRILCIALCLLNSIPEVYSQLVPSAGAHLNYNQVMFEHPAVQGASAYLIQISSDTTDINFKRPFAEVQDSFPATIVSHLKFGTNYIWRYVAIVKGQKTAWSAPSAFCIDEDPFAVGKAVRLHILKNDSLKNEGGLVAVDNLHGIFDRNGNVVWFFPGFIKGPRKDVGTDDLFLNTAGTITMLGGQNAAEFNLEGNQLWTNPPVPPQDKTLAPLGGFYHHDLKRLPNSHYMVISEDFVWKKIPPDFSINKLLSYSDTSTHQEGKTPEGERTLSLLGGWIIKFNNTGAYVYMNMSKLVEFDKKNNVVWSWRAADNIKDEDIFPAGTDLEAELVRQEPHLNGFCIDANNEFVYISFKNYSRVLKVEKKTGKEVFSWGRKMASGEALEGDTFFRHQHAPVILKDGSLAIFDNSDMRVGDKSCAVRVISQPDKTKHSKIVWQYNCIFEPNIWRNKSARGGNIEEMKNGNFLVCEGGINRIFEITRNKNLVWQAMVEKKTENDTAWKAFPLYRSHYSSSLYPCYFVTQIVSETPAKKSLPVKIKIFNAGTDSDSYTVQLMSASTSFTGPKAPVTIAGRHSAEVTLSPLAGKTAAGEKLQVKITSHNNPDNVRVEEVVMK
jgi:hypothetical protein